MTTQVKGQAAFIRHHGFDIPRHLAWRTGRLERFREVSDDHIAILRAYGGLDEAGHVVEIGCGVGRDAAALLAILPPDGSYLGIDIFKPSIDWAAANIAPRDDRFAFQHFDVDDGGQHNPGGTHDMAAMRIPRADASVDLIFLFSVFTHMFPGDVASYLREFSRILSPSGRMVASMFTMTRDLIPHLDAVGGGGLRNLTFAHEVEPGFFHNDPAVVPGTTAYGLERFGAMARQVGLWPDRFLKGSWRKDGQGDLAGQDVVVLRKPAF